MKFFAAALIFLSLSSRAAIIDTVEIYSHAMKHSRKAIVIRPFVADQKPIPVPVVYLLHGYDGDYSNWIKRVPNLPELADRYQVMIVCPDGHRSSWYLDSPVDSTMCYETYISREVPAYIDSTYLTIPARNAKAITGLSMGGYGAFLIALRNPATFGACGSMSGGMDPVRTINKYDLMKRIGDTIKYAANWEHYSIINMIENKKTDSIAMIFDCGIDDQFYSVNKKLHERMLQLKIPHDYIERPGGHSWKYWGNAVEYQLLFFRKYFGKP